MGMRSNDSVNSCRVRNVRIVTKTAVGPKPAVFGQEDTDTIRAAFFTSLDRLRQDRVYGLLIHHGSDLLIPGGERLIELLSSLKRGGQVEKVGVSIYSGDELDGVLEKFVPDIVQLPLNIADQRLRNSGHLAKLDGLGVEIHVRSVLQGVLLAAPDSLPAYKAACAKVA